MNQVRARYTRSLLAASVLASASAAWAQTVPTALLRENVSIPGAALSDPIRLLDSLSINNVGGFLIRARIGPTGTITGGNTTDHLLGTTSTFSPSAPIVATEAGNGFILYGSTVLTDSGKYAVSGRVSESTSPSLSAIAFDGVKLIQQGQPVAPGIGYDPAAFFWGRDLSLAGAASDGTVYFNASVNSASTLPTAGEVVSAFFRRNPNGSITTLLRSDATNTAVGSIKNDLAATKVSPNGRFLVEVPVIGSGTATFPGSAILVDGTSAFRLASGGILRVSGDLATASTMNWVDNANDLPQVTGMTVHAINDRGTTGLRAALRGPNTPSNADEGVLIDGRIRYREGSLISNVRPTGLINNIRINGSDDVLWEMGSQVFLNDDLVIATGITVNDGTTNTPLTAFLGTTANLQMSERDASGNVTVFFSGRVNGEDGSNDRLFRVTLNAAGSRWNAASGAWDTAGNWLNGLPDRQGGRATFEPRATPTTVTLAADRTVSALVLSGTSAYTFSGTGALRLNNYEGTARIRVESGAHTVGVDLVPESNVSLDVLQAGSVLTLTKPLVTPLAPPSSARAVYKTGAGRVDLPRIATADLAIDAGTLRITGAAGVNASEINRLYVSPTGLLDLGVKSLVVHNATEADLRAYVAAWRNGGANNGPGIGSSAASPGGNTTVAVFPNSLRDALPYFESFAGVTTSPSDLILRYTYLGDTNLDGLVNGADLARAIEGLTLGLTGWRNGDVNYDGVVNATDIAAISALAALNLPGIGTDTGTPPGGAIPEPTTAALLLAPATALLRRRR